MNNEEESINKSSYYYEEEDESNNKSETNQGIPQEISDESSLTLEPKVQTKKFNFRDILGILFFFIFFLAPTLLSIYVSTWLLFNNCKILIINKFISIIIGYVASFDYLLKSISLYLYGTDNRPKKAIIAWILFCLVDISDSIFTIIIRRDLRNKDSNKYNKSIGLILTINMLKSFIIVLSDIGFLKGCPNN